MGLLTSSKFLGSRSGDSPRSHGKRITICWRKGSGSCLGRRQMSQRQLQQQRRLQQRGHELQRRRRLQQRRRQLQQRGHELQQRRRLQQRGGENKQKKELLQLQQEAHHVRKSNGGSNDQRQPKMTHLELHLLKSQQGTSEWKIHVLWEPNARSSKSQKHMLGCKCKPTNAEAPTAIIKCTIYVL